MELKLRKIGNSVGVVLPKEILSKLNSTEGDSLFAVETKDGVTLTPYDPALEDAMRIARKIMNRDKEALRELAK